MVGYKCDLEIGEPSQAHFVEDGLVGTETERFRKISLSDADLDSLTIFDRPYEWLSRRITLEYARERRYAGFDIEEELQDLLRNPE